MWTIFKFDNCLLNMLSTLNKDIIIIKFKQTNRIRNVNKLIMHEHKVQTNGPNSLKTFARVIVLCSLIFFKKILICLIRDTDSFTRQV